VLDPGDEVARIIGADDALSDMKPETNNAQWMDSSSINELLIQP
jgi:hypothetical protein